MATKSPNHPSMRSNASTADQKAEQAIRPVMQKFIEELVKSGSAKVLTTEESAAILENTEFSGCIARPKNSSSSTTKA